MKDKRIIFTDDAKIEVSLVRSGRTKLKIVEHEPIGDRREVPIALAYLTEQQRQDLIAALTPPHGASDD